MMNVIRDFMISQTALNGGFSEILKVIKNIKVISIYIFLSIHQYAY